MQFYPNYAVLYLIANLIIYFYFIKSLNTNAK